MTVFCAVLGQNSNLRIVWTELKFRESFRFRLRLRRTIRAQQTAVRPFLCAILSRLIQQLHIVRPHAGIQFTDTTGACSCRGFRTIVTVKSSHQHRPVTPYLIDTFDSAESHRDLEFGQNVSNLFHNSVLACDGKTVHVRSAN